MVAECWVTWLILKTGCSEQYGEGWSKQIPCKTLGKSGHTIWLRGFGQLMVSRNDIEEQLTHNGSSWASPVQFKGRHRHAQKAHTRPAHRAVEKSIFPEYSEILQRID